MQIEKPFREQLLFGKKFYGIDLVIQLAVSEEVLEVGIIAPYALVVFAS